MIGRVIQEEFDVRYHPGHVGKVLKALGFSVQRPEQDRWQRYTYPRLKKTAERKAALLFGDEVSFRQDPTLYQTWSRRGHQPWASLRGSDLYDVSHGCGRALPQAGGLLHSILEEMAAYPLGGFSRADHPGYRLSRGTGHGGRSTVRAMGAAPRNAWCCAEFGFLTERRAGGDESGKHPLGPLWGPCAGGSNS